MQSDLYEKIIDSTEKDLDKELVKLYCDIVNEFNDTLREKIPASLIYEKFKGNDFSNYIISICCSITVTNLYILKKIYEVQDEEILKKFCDKLSHVYMVRSLIDEKPEIFDRRMNKTVN